MEEKENQKKKRREGDKEDGGSRRRSRRKKEGESSDEYQEEIEQEDEEDENFSKVYQVEKIEKHRINRGRYEFYIKWKGYPSSDNTWEIEKNISPTLVEEYLAKNNEKRSPYSTRSQTQKKKQSKKRRHSSSSEEEEEEEESEEEEEKPKKSGKRQKVNSDDESWSKTNRRSIRASKFKGSYKEKTEEDYHKLAEQKKTPPKPKKELSKFPCDECKGFGESLIECTKCTKHFHLRCTRKPKITKDMLPKLMESKDWSCHKCNQFRCDLCKKVEYEDKDKALLQFCSNCSSYYHPQCWQTTENNEKSPNGRKVDDKWICKDCISEELKKQTSVETIIKERSCTDNGRPSKEYLVKWNDKSHLHNSWVVKRRLKKLSLVKLNNFLDRLENSPDEMDNLMEMVSVWQTVERIISQKQDDGSVQYLVKWLDLGYEEATWETEQTLKQLINGPEEIESLLKREIIAQEKFNLAKKNRLTPPQIPKKSETNETRRVYNQNPTFLSPSLDLYQYQLDGLNFLHSSWENNTHVILADEMGLGKTIMAIAYILSIRHTEGEKSPFHPFLIIAPLSTVSNWKREFTKWGPRLNVVTYVGNKYGRPKIRETEFWISKEAEMEKITKYDVLITSYELCMKESKYMDIQWQSLLIDEGHRLKNEESLLYKKLAPFNVLHRIVLTGTPMQNNIKELFTLLHFIEPSYNIMELEKKFSLLTNEEQISELHKLLKPHILRRLKQDVMKDVPPKIELVVPVTLTKLQKETYKNILTRNFEILRHGPRATSKKLNNVLSALQKCVNHPYLFDGLEPETTSKEEEQKRMIEASGKMVLMDKLLTKLKAGGHRVLIFSQMTSMLTIIEDYLDNRGWKYCRLDGAVDQAKRQHDIDKFNNSTDEYFVYLLSTRAGGLGINLPTADTVILYDFGFNPHDEKQAVSRAHRIGQKSKVLVFQFVSRHTIEEAMIERAKVKLALEHVVVKKMRSGFNQGELSSILTYGAKKLFQTKKKEKGKENEMEVEKEDKDGSDSEDDEEVIDYTEEALDKLLDRSQQGLPEDAIDATSTFLKTFQVAEVAQVSSDLAREAPTPGSDFWENLLHERFEKMKKDQQTKLGRGMRRRRNVNYKEASRGAVENDDDDEPDFELASEDEESSSTGSLVDEKILDDIGEETKTIKRKPLRKTKLPILESKSPDPPSTSTSVGTSVPSSAPLSSPSPTGPNQFKSTLSARRTIQTKTTPLEPTAQKTIGISPSAQGLISRGTIQTWPGRLPLSSMTSLYSNAYDAYLRNTRTNAVPLSIPLLPVRTPGDNNIFEYEFLNQALKNPTPYNYGNYSFNLQPSIYTGRLNLRQMDPTSPNHPYANLLNNPSLTSTTKSVYPSTTTNPSLSQRVTTPTSGSITSPTKSHVVLGKSNEVLLSATNPKTALRTLPTPIEITEDEPEPPKDKPTIPANPPTQTDKSPVQIIELKESPQAIPEPEVKPPSPSQPHPSPSPSPAPPIQQNEVNVNSNTNTGISDLQPTEDKEKVTNHAPEEETKSSSSINGWMQDIILSK